MNNGITTHPNLCKNCPISEQWVANKTSKSGHEFTGMGKSKKDAIRNLKETIRFVEICTGKRKRPRDKTLKS